VSLSSGTFNKLYFNSSKASLGAKPSLTYRVVIFFLSSSLF